MKNVRIISAIILGLILLTGFAFGSGYLDVLYTKTVGKAKQDASREVFEESQSYVEGKRQEAVKMYREYRKAEPEDRQSIKQMVALSFANFDESKLPLELRNFVTECKYD